MGQQFGRQQRQICIFLLFLCQQLQRQHRIFGRDGIIQGKHADFRQRGKQHIHIRRGPVLPVSCIHGDLFHFRRQQLQRRIVHGCQVFLDALHRAPVQAPAPLFRLPGQPGRKIPGVHRGTVHKSCFLLQKLGEFLPPVHLFGLQDHRTKIRYIAQQILKLLLL